MKSIIVLLLAPLSLALKFKGCPYPYCPLSFDGFTCAYDEVCGFQAENECQLRVEICLRELNNRPRFIKMVSGYCVDKSKRRCTPMVTHKITDIDLM
ncbi:uncharacterized protein LOC113565539 [Drosophila persimilis]|uniref:uncharacterized protein LOC113565539 n=1 Tax=Drosophila persimilis TaxID=7234 RepID=UPI000F073F26|nr:uncharacterized protein LOC113565539 [Drosophila persimilis]